MKLHNDEINKNARGGSEIQAEYLMKYVDPTLLDEFQIVVSRCRELQDRPRLFWVKDLHSDPEVQRLRDDAFLNQFEYVVHNSFYQRDMYRAHLGIPYEKSHVLRNAIEPSVVDIDSKLNPWKVKLIYSSTPQRGLNILYSVFDELYKDDKDIELNVYSSFDIYGHHERNRPFLPLFEKCKAHPGINYYGSVPHEELLERTKEQHILAFPSIWEETSCTTVLENMSAGNLVVTSSLGALPETCSGFASMYDYTPDLQTHASRFYHNLKSAIMTVRGLQSKVNGYTVDDLLHAQKEYVDHFYSWELRGTEWTEFLTKLKK